MIRLGGKVMIRVGGKVMIRVGGKVMIRVGRLFYLFPNPNPDPNQVITLDFFNPHFARKVSNVTDKTRHLDLD